MEKQNNIDHRLDRLERVVLIGNGKESFSETISRINERQSVMIDELKGVRNDMESLRTVISGFTKFQEGLKGERRVEERHNRLNRWLITILVPTLITLAGFLFFTK